jgi:hypothetical protein
MDARGEGTGALLRERREHGAAARIRALVFVGVCGRRGVATEMRIGAGDQAIDRLVAGRGHGSVEVRTVDHDLEQDRSTHLARFYSAIGTSVSTGAA